MPLLVGKNSLKPYFFFWKSGQFCGSDFGSRFLATKMGVKSSCGQRFSSWESFMSSASDVFF